MRNLSKSVGIIAASAIIALFAASNVYAEGLGVSLDKDACDVGDRIVVTVDASSIGDGTVPPDVQVEFDSRRLNFETCSVDFGGGGGGLVTFKDTAATVEFTTLSGGNADISVTATPDDGAGPETTTVTAIVSGEDTAALAGDMMSSDLGVSAGTIDIGEGRVIQAVFADEFKPILFHKETADYNGQTVECAKFDMGDMTLLYTTDSAGADGRFMIYNSATSELSDFRMIQGIENRFIIVLSDCEGPIPSGYTKAVLEWNGQTLTAFMEESVAAGNTEPVDGINPGDFFLVYAMSSEGNKGWYRYDKNEGTYQRFLNSSDGGAAGEGGDSAETDTDTAGLLDDYIPRNIQSILVLACVPFAIILLITVIILAVKLRDYSDELDAFYEEYYGDEEEEDEEEEKSPKRTAKPGAVTAASLVGRSMADDTEEDEEDEEDEEEEEDEDDDVRDEDGEDKEDEEQEEEEEEDDEEDEEDERYSRPLTRREQRELAREEKWRLKEEKKAAKRRAQGYEEATPMDWSSFEKERDDDVKIAELKRSKPPKYMTESMKVEIGDESDMMEEEEQPRAPLPPRKKTVTAEAVEKPRALHEEDQRERQRRLFEQQQRIEEQRRIEKEMQEEQRLREQQQFIASRTEDTDLDEDFQFEFLDIN